MLFINSSSFLAVFFRRFEIYRLKCFVFFKYFRCFSFLVPILLPPPPDVVDVAELGFTNNGDILAAFLSASFITFFPMLLKFLIGYGLASAGADAGAAYWVSICVCGDNRCDGSGSAF